MLDDSPHHARGAFALPGFLLTHRVTPLSSKQRYGSRPPGRAPPAPTPCFECRVQRSRSIFKRLSARQLLEEGNDMSNYRNATLVVAVATTLAAIPAHGAVTAPSGYIYSTQLLPTLTQNCIAAGPGGTFVGIGPGFTANAQSIVLAKESGELRLVASGFNSISDCAYDRAADVLYVTDNADNGDFGITGFPAQFAAQTGDTVFAIPSASAASGLTAPGLEVLPPDSIPSAASVTVDASGALFVSDAVGGGSGRVLKIVGASSSLFFNGLDFAGGLAVSPTTGNLFLAQSLTTFENQIDQLTPAGVLVPPSPFAGPSYGFGSVDLAFNSDGRLLASGVFAGDVLSFDPGTAASTPFVSGLTFAGGMTVDPFTRRVQVLSSTFTGADEDKSLHRFTPVVGLVAGGGSSATDCAHEAYGLALVDGKAVCDDGAPCDGDGTVNDACVFPLGFCLNVSDPTLAGCSTTSPVAEVSITAKPVAAAISAVAARMGATLPVVGPTCFFSDGYYLPVKIANSGAKKDGKATVKVTATRADGSKDTDTLKLVCRPAGA